MNHLSTTQHPKYNRPLLFLFSIIIFLLVDVCQSVAQIHIIPQPVHVTELKGNFKLKNGGIIAVDGQSLAVGNYLQQYLSDTYHISLNVKQYIKLPRNAAIQLIANSVADEKPENGYVLLASTKRINIIGNGAALFYGVQTLIQMINSDKGNVLTIPACTIVDYPRFGWRGLSIDVSRHFFTVDEVKKYIDIMAHYKLDVLHWHLTDDEGWRIQIKKYPLLTDVGSKMAYYAHIGKFRKMDNLVDSGRDGFYTQDDIRSVVKYAQDRYITILPEIEMPGHSEAAIFSYPELRCKDSTGANKRTRMLDPSEYTFNFYENVLTEVMQLFPNKYIHIGGDEAEMVDWLKSPTAVALMKREHFTDVREIQSYFIKRIETFLNDHGRKLIGWDEILQGGLAPSATVMSWEGEEGGITAARMHHNVVMTPLPQMYFDAPNDKAENEPIGWNDPVSWQMVYNYEPQSSQLSEEDAKYILGAQANLWAEKIGTFSHLEYMVYPRVLALAELTWTPKADKNIERFEQGMYANYRLFNLWNVNARLPDASGFRDVITNKDTYATNITYPLAGARIQYTIIKKLPDTTSPQLQFPVTIVAPLKDSINIAAYITRPRSERILQTAAIRHISLEPVADAHALRPGLSYFAYKTMYSNYPTLDTAASFVTGIWRNDELIRPFPGQFNTWVKLSGYIKIETEGDYQITTEFENSPLIMLDRAIIINNNKNRYIEPQVAILHLKKGLYLLNGYYLADAANSHQTLLTIKTGDGKPLETSEYLFH
jgi:hexosaminidase